MEGASLPINQSASQYSLAFATHVRFGASRYRNTLRVRAKGPNEHSRSPFCCCGEACALNKFNVLTCCFTLNMVPATPASDHCDV
jgi:hypothetical protein